VKKKLKQIFDALSTALGDTDPFIDEDVTDDEIRDDEPVFWAAKELAGILQSNKLGDLTVREFFHRPLDTESKDCDGCLVERFFPFAYCPEFCENLELNKEVFEEEIEVPNEG